MAPLTFRQLCTDNQNAPRSFIVDNLIAEQSTNIAVGDSGLGKSPWVYQLSLAVCHGIPFHGMSTRRGRVIYCDLENSQIEIEKLVKTQSAFLGQGEPWDQLISVTEGADLEKLDAYAAELKPALVVIDPLRMWQPDAEKTEISSRLLAEIRTMGNKFGFASLILHHPRKTSKDAPVPDLRDSNVLDWLQCASGARGLISHTDTRIAFQRVQSDDSLVVKWNRRIVGDSGAYQFQRIYNPEGEPLGYRSMCGAQLLNNSYMQKRWELLPPKFSFSEAKAIYGKQSPATNHWLQRCISVGIIERNGAGYYRLEQA